MIITKYSRITKLNKIQQRYNSIQTNDVCTIKYNCDYNPKSTMCEYVYVCVKIIKEPTNKQIMLEALI